MINAITIRNNNKKCLNKNNKAKETWMGENNCFPFIITSRLHLPIARNTPNNHGYAPNASADFLCYHPAHRINSRSADKSLYAKASAKGHYGPAQQQTKHPVATGCFARQPQHF